MGEARFVVAQVTQPETGLCACILHREAPALSGQVETVQELCEKMDGGEVDASEAKMLPCGYVSSVHFSTVGIKCSNVGLFFRFARVLNLKCVTLLSSCVSSQVL